MKQLIISMMATLVLFSASFIDAQAAEDDLIYTVKKSDTVWGVCKAYVSDPLCWQKLVAYNQIKNPKYLPPKSTVRIPKAWLIDHPTTALVIAVEGEVNVVREGIKEKRLFVADQLSQEDIVKALNGSAMIQFADESRMLLKANSTIRMASLQFYDSDQLVSTRVELLKGRVKALVEKISNKNSRYEISTPAAVAAVRGTEFRVGYAESTEGSAVMRTELLEGALELTSDTNQQDIIAGQAVMAIEGQGVSEPVALLPRPLMALNESKTLTLPFDIQWQPIDGAISYKVSLMMGDGQLWEISTEETYLTLQDLDSGNFELLIRGVDSQGFEGRNRRVKIDLP